MSSSDLETAQDIVDTVTVQQIEPASGVSACPGQDVTINCTIVRETTVSEAEQPTLNWLYRDIMFTYRNGVLQPNSDPLNNGVFTAVFSYSNFFVSSTATIINVPLSHHNSSIQCFVSASTLSKQVKTIKIAGEFKLKWKCVISIMI